VARLPLVPGDDFHGNVTADLVRQVGGPAVQLRVVLVNAFDAALHGRDADSLQFLDQVWRGGHLIVIGEMACHPGQSGSQSLRADVIEGLPNDSDGVIYFVPICRAPLLDTRLSFQVPVHEPDQALAVASSHFLHLVQKCHPFPPVAREIAHLHDLQILPSLIESHLDLGWHGFPPVTLSFEGTMIPQ
jgi:hypothetical protein